MNKEKTRHEHNELPRQKIDRGRLASDVLDNEAVAHVLASMQSRTDEGLATVDLNDHAKLMAAVVDWRQARAFTGKLRHQMLGGMDAEKELSQRVEADKATGR